MVEYDEHLLALLSWEHKHNLLTNCLLHDLSNHLTGILALSELYCQNSASPSLIDGLNTIRDSALKIRKLLSTLSNLNHANTDTPRHLDLKDTLNELLPLFKAIVPSHTQFEVHANEPTLIYMPLGTLQQILFQIIFNAGEAIKSVDHPHISLRLQSDTPSTVDLYIKDNGQGAHTPIEALASPIQSNDNQHFGIGLFAVKHLMEEQGARVHIQSDNSGTLIHLSFKSLPQ